MEPNHWHIEPHEDFDYESFLGSLNPVNGAAVATFLESVESIPELKFAPKDWIKPLGEGLFEFRISGRGLLVRIFFTYKKGRIVLLLGAYDKGSDPSKKRQQREIDIARKRLESA